MDERKADVNKVIEPLAENYLRLNALGAYGSFFNIYYCSIRIKINGPAGSDILIPFGGPPDPSKGRCSGTMARAGEGDPVRTGIFGIALVTCLVLVSFGYTGLPFWPQGKDYSAFFTDAGGITPGSDVSVSGIKVGKVSSIELAGEFGQGELHGRPQGPGRRPVSGVDQDRHRGLVRSRSRCLRRARAVRW